jgi:hypothetical protein
MPNGRTHLTRLGALALASAATLGTAGVAGATTPASSGTTGSSGSNDVPSTLAGIKAKANTDITDRVNSLNSAIQRAKGTKGLGSGQGTLETYLGTDIAPLQQLDATIQGATSTQQAAQEFGTIFTNFRVYRLVLPAAHIAGDAFRVTTTAVPNLQSASTKAQQHVNPGNQGVLEPLIDDLNGQISAASNATNGLAATVLAYTPQQWNANNNLLAPSKQSDAQADAAVAKGRQDAVEIRAIVKHHVQGSPDAPSAAGGTPTTT